MKDIRPALRTLLLSDATINSLVGGSRIWSVLLPQGQRSPSLVFRRITDFSDNHMNGDSGLQQTFMQIDAFATSHDGSVSLADAVHDLLSGFYGVVEYGSNSPPDFVQFQGIFQSNGRDLFDDPTQMFHMSRDYRIFYGDR